MIPCRTCARHVRDPDAPCPFCGGDIAPRTLVGGALGGAVSFIVLAACYGSPHLDGKPDFDTGLFDTGGECDRPPDRDDDRLPNSYEARRGTDPDDPDSDGDGLSDYAELEVVGTDPRAADSDGGGTIDGVERRIDGTDPFDPTDDVPDLSDTDGDGLPDREEELHGSDPSVVDTDADGLSDHDEARVHHTSPVRADTDGDGFRDLAEILAGTSPFDRCDHPAREDTADTGDSGDSGDSGDTPDDGDTTDTAAK